MWSRVDPTIRWLRREITWYLTRRVAAEYVLAGLVLLGLLSASGRPPLGSLALALAGAQVIVLGRVALGLARNPVNFWASRASTEAPLRLIATPSLSEDAATMPQTRVLQTSGYSPVVTARASSADGQPLYDIYQRPDFVTTVAIGRAGKTRVALSRLRDGRILVSSDLLVPPSNDLIVNIVTKPMPATSVTKTAGDVGISQADDHDQDSILQTILGSHQRLIEGLRAKGVFAEPAHPSVFVEMLNIEQQTFDEIGPFLTPFLSLTCRHSPLQLSLVLDPRTVLRRSPLGRETIQHQRVAPSQDVTSRRAPPAGAHASEANPIRVPSV